MFPDGPQVTDTQMKAVKKTQVKVARHVEKELLHIGPTAFKGIAVLMLAFAHALLPRAHIVQLLMKPFLLEDEAGVGPAEPC